MGALGCCCELWTMAGVKQTTMDDGPHPARPRPVDRCECAAMWRGNVSAEVRFLRTDRTMLPGIAGPMHPAIGRAAGCRAEP